MISAEVRKTLDLIVHSLDQNAFEALTERWRSLQKEPAGMGAVESAALHYCLLSRREPAGLDRKALYVVCAAQDFGAEDDHGAPSPQQRFEWLTSGRTAASALARLMALDMVVVNAAVADVPEEGAVTLQLAASSADASKGPAMTELLANEALEAGIILASDASKRFDAVGLACMDGQTNTAAATLASALTGCPAGKWLYCEPSLGEAQRGRRQDAVRLALLRNKTELALPFEALRSVGSIDIAVMTGFLLGAAWRRLPVVLDGFAATVAALMAKRLAPDVIDVCLFSHAKPGPAHAGLLEMLNVEPILTGITEEGGYGAAFALLDLDLALRVLQVLNRPATLE